MGGVPVPDAHLKAAAELLREILGAVSSERVDQQFCRGRHGHHIVQNDFFRVEFLL